MNQKTLQKTPIRVGVINTDAGNIFSLLACLRRSGFEPILLDAPSNEVDALLLPGQGRFGTVMQAIRTKNLESYIRNWIEDERAVVGICVGQQILFEGSEEDPQVLGLGILAGRVTRLESPKQPMVGWCQVAMVTAEETPINSAVYFVNSYAAKSSDCSIATATYGEQFVAAIQYKNTRTFQFHPEKSGEYGEKLLQQTLEQLVANDRGRVGYE